MSSKEDPGEYRIEYDPNTENEITNAIGEIMGRRRNSMVTKAIVICEVMNEDGERAVWTSASPGLATWDEAGLLHHAMAKVDNFDLLRRLAALENKEDE